MLVKDYKLVFSEEINRLAPRCDFLLNGLFRMTQPKYLNDKGSESRLLPYFNQFSPADYEWAKKEHAKWESNPSYEPSNEELEFYLRPVGRRYGEDFPHLLKNEGFESMEEFDYAELCKIATSINNYLVEVLSCQLGVFSLCNTDTNENMWTYYANDGEGLAIKFKEEHYFFKIFQPKKVNYKPEKRASLTYYKGMVRLNGLPLKKFFPNNYVNSSFVLSPLLNDEINLAGLAERILYSKAENWKVEDEVRIICPLRYCEEKKGQKTKPKIEIELPPTMHDYHNEQFEINLKKIPFDAFDSLIFGYNMKEEDIALAINKANQNPELAHLKFKQAKHDVFGNIKIYDYKK